MPSYHRVFMSHAHTDNTICKQYADALRAKGIDVWIDLTNAQQGHDLGEEIAHELRERTAFVLMVTADSNASHWVRQERSAYNFLMNTNATHAVNGVERMILPVRLGDDVPTLLGGIYWVDALNQPLAPVVERIAAALALSPDNDWDEIGIHGRLYDLGFRDWRVRATGVEFILPPTCDVAAGSFLMGSADSDEDARDDEKPQYRIPVGAFAIGTFPVTVEEYRLYLKANPTIAVPQGNDDDVYGWKQQQTRPDHPVVRVTWFNARDYTVWLAKTTSQPWRLPTEAEWEKAARWDAAKQVSRIYPWGDTFDKTRANTFDGGPGHTTPVGSYPTGKSPYGTQDMAGNVWEWCSSLYKAQYPYNSAVSEDLGNRMGVRVLRGGSWAYLPRSARVAYRGGSNPDLLLYIGGFRVGLGSGLAHHSTFVLVFFCSINPCPSRRLLFGVMV